MALFMPGMPCAFCGHGMLRRYDIVMFPPFVANAKDPLIAFSDGVFHRACFERHPLADRARRRRDEATAMLAPDKRICVVCGDRIRNPDDYFTLGFLTDDATSPLFEFNYLRAHRSHLSSWPRYAELRRLVEQFELSAAWDGPRAVFP
jgi:hypothetical protein